VVSTETRSRLFLTTRSTSSSQCAFLRAFYVSPLHFVIELTTENPSEIWLAIERGAWAPKIDFPPVRIAHFSKPAFDFGIETHQQGGVQLRVYSPAKTIADCFKFRSKMGTETAIQALRAAYREKKATMDELWKAAKVCRVSNIIRPYMESLT